jgi:hypothetical protein
VPGRRSPFAEPIDTDKERTGCDADDCPDDCPMAEKQTKCSANGNKDSAELQVVPKCGFLSRHNKINTVLSREARLVDC